MNAKELLRRKLTEADDDIVPPEHSPGTAPRGREFPAMPPRRLPRRRPIDPDEPGMDLGGSPVDQMTGREAGPRGQFSPKEISQLKDVLILILAKISGSELDADIGRKLMSGQDPDPNQLQHILDEARQLDIPESHHGLMQKLFTSLSQQ